MFFKRRPKPPRLYAVIDLCQRAQAIEWRMNRLLADGYRIQEILPGGCGASPKILLKRRYTHEPPTPLSGL